MKTNTSDFWSIGHSYSDNSLVGYAYNAMLSPSLVAPNQGAPIAKQNIRDPYLTLLIADAEGIPYFGWAIDSGPNRDGGTILPFAKLPDNDERDFYATGLPRSPLDPVLGAMRHTNGLNALFVDGSVKYMPNNSIDIKNMYWEVGP
jgi:prepilin-type processing-associated H-X9-DG protein